MYAAFSQTSGSLVINAHRITREEALQQLKEVVREDSVLLNPLINDLYTV